MPRISQFRGSGKTATTLAVAATHFAVGTIDLVIVVGPLSSFAPWEKESRTALHEAFRVSRVRGSAQARRDMYAAGRAWGATPDELR